MDFATATPGDNQASTRIDLGEKWERLKAPSACFFERHARMNLNSLPSIKYE